MYVWMCVPYTAEKIVRPSFCCDVACGYWKCTKCCMAFWDSRVGNYRPKRETESAKNRVVSSTI